MPKRVVVFATANCHERRGDFSDIKLEIGEVAEQIHLVIQD